MEKRNYQYLLFDLDNTLLDFSKSQTYSLEKVFADFKIEFLEEYHSIYDTINHQCWSDFEQGKMTQEVLRTERMRRLLLELGFSTEPVAFSQQYQYNLGQTSFWIDGAKELLDTLKKRFNLILITNGLKEVQRPRLEKTGLNPYFQQIVISDEIGVAKPQTAFFETTFRLMDSPPKEEVLVIGDNMSSDIVGGHDYGVDTCWYNPQNKLNSLAILPTYEIKTLDELLPIVHTSQPIS